MLELQRWLLSNKLEDLTTLGIKHYRHPAFSNLVGFKYDQIDADRRCPIVQEARGIVLDEAAQWKLVARPFKRFFNVGELEDTVTVRTFDWNNFTATEKVDGSLIILYHYNDHWHANTSGSFGLGDVTKNGPSWRDLFWQTSNLDPKRLLKSHTYLFELCTPLNKVVRTYKKPVAYLLGCVETDSGYQHPEDFLEGIAENLSVPRPMTLAAKSQEELSTWLTETTKTDPTFEGFVLRDNNDRRLKLKSQTYLSFHRLKDNGNIILPHNLVSVVLGGELPEVLAVMPELTGALTEVKSRLDLVQSEIESLWNKTKVLGTQKDFALAVKDHAFSGLLFTARKTGQLDKLATEDARKIADKLFAGKVFAYDDVVTT